MSEQRTDNVTGAGFVETHLPWFVEIPLEWVYTPELLLKECGDIGRYEFTVGGFIASGELPEPDHVTDAQSR